MSKKRLIKIIASLLLFSLVLGCVNFAVVPVQYAHWYMHDRRKLHGQIDTIIVGDSFAMGSVQPSVLDQRTGSTSINAGTASQHLRESYYLIQDFVQTENIKRVYLGLDFYNFLDQKSDQLIRSMVVYKRLTHPGVKLRYLKEYVELKDAWKWVFSAYGKSEKLLNIRTTLSAKLSSEYRHYAPLNRFADIPDFQSYYFDKGYVRCDTKTDNDVKNVTDLSNLSDSYYQDFCNIITYCQDNQVELILFHSPISQSRLATLQNYDYLMDHIRTTAKENGIVFYDFNQHPNRNQMPDDTSFADSAHLNYTGSCIFMDWFCNEFGKAIAE